MKTRAFASRLALTVIGAAIVWQPGIASAAAAPGSWGVNVQTPFKGAALKGIGAQWVRATLQWPTSESKVKGQYDFSGADKVFADYLGNGLHVLVVLNVATLNPMYAAQASDTAALTSAITAWASAVAQHYKGKGFVYEIGNEPEMTGANLKWSDPSTYTAMARAAAKAIKQADSASKVAVLALAWMDRTFAAAALKAGLLADGTVDYVSFHGYHRPTIDPESGLSDDITWLRSAVQSATGSGATPAQVIDSEAGYGISGFDPTKTSSNWRLTVASETTQTAYVARHFLEEISLGLPISIWYKDMSGEQSFSLWYTDDKDPRGLRPMGRAFRTLALLLPDNPASLQNHQFTPSVSPKGDTSSASPQPNLYVRSYLRATGSHTDLIVAVWNAVESWDGKILQSRTFSGSQVVEKWRGVSGSDAVQIPVEVDLATLKAGAVHSASVIALPDGQTSGTVTVRDNSGQGIAFDTVASPIPTLIKLSIDAGPASPNDVRVR